MRIVVKIGEHRIGHSPSFFASDAIAAISTTRTLGFVGPSKMTNFVFGWVKGKRDPVLDRMIGVVEDLAGSL